MVDVSRIYKTMFSVEKERCVILYVISGGVVRNYYHRCGYQLNNEKDGAYVVKHLRYTFSETCVDMLRFMYGREQLRTYEECAPYVALRCTSDMYFFVTVVSSCITQAFPFRILINNIYIII
jgi:hypothetical protein